LDNSLRLKVIQSLLYQFEALYLTLPDGQPIYEAWRSRLVTLGKKVKATWKEQVIEGLAESVDEDGALWIRSEDRELIKVVAGDVTLRE
jgi:BirA family transcriptional regulator, biotin operon repressor / biotin---[acetyl-CoA-carboxylase] ligase